jgi:hypothetical protein
VRRPCRFLAALSHDRAFFRVVFAHERFCHPQNTPASRWVRRAEDHADAILLGSRSRRLREELGNLDAQRAREAHERLERWVRIRGRASAEDSFESGNRFDGYARACCELGLSESGFKAELSDVICQSSRYVGQFAVSQTPAR